MNEFIENMVFNTPVLVDGSLCEYKLFKDGFLHFYNIDQNVMVKVLLSDEERLERIDEMFDEQHYWMDGWYNFMSRTFN